MAATPLSRIRVLDFTQIWAGPYAVMLLADMGAETIRVESCQRHIINTRGYMPKVTKEQVPRLGYLAGLYVDMDPGERPWNRHAMFNALGRNRLSMTVDMAQPQGFAIVRELVRVSDVLIENQTRGQMDALGLDWKTVHTLNPTMVYVTMPLHGLSGPYRNYRGFGANGEAMSGVASLRGYLDGDPSTSGQGNHMDAASGIIAAYATLAALFQRNREGKGQFIEVCQVEHLITQIGGPLMDAAMNLRAQAPTGNRDPVRAPQGTYRCAGPSTGSGQADRWVHLSAGTDAEWAGLCEVIGRLDLARDPAYSSNIARQRRHDEIDAAISRWAATMDSREAMRALQAHGVPAGMVANDRDCHEDPHLDARDFFQWVTQADCGRHRYPGHPFKYSQTPLRFELPPPLLGEHNRYVYQELLALGAQEVRRLTALGHIGDRYAPDAR